MGPDFEIIDDTPREPDPPTEERLNLTRIRAIAQERRAAHRRRLWARAIAFAFACLTAMTGVDAFRVEGSRRLWFAAASIAFLLLAIRAALRLRRFNAPPSPEPAPRPDPSAFDALSDGRQFARRLDELHRDP